MRSVSIIIFIVIIALGLYFAFQKYCGGIYVEKHHTETYACSGEKNIAVRFFSTSDRMLMFVKVVLPDGVAYSLPLMPSASGSRYSDEFTLEAWFKGNELTVSKPSEHGPMEPIYECTAK